MKIGITCYPVYGGSGVVATELGLELARRGHEIHFISYAQPFRLPYFVDNVFYHEVDVPSYPLFEYPPYSLALAVAMFETAQKGGLDILHAHYAIPHATSAWIAKEMLIERGETPAKIVTTLHGTDITLVGQDPSFRPITRTSLMRSDGITSVSDYLRNETERVFAIERERIEVIPNFVDLEKYNRANQPCHAGKLAAPGEKLVMHISNFRPVKRLEDVVRAFARIVKEVPARLILIGDGPDRGKAQHVARVEGIRDHVIFLGKVESVAELLSCADLLLLPSETESFGLVALEAMACGVPVVATEVGGVPEVVTHGENGFLVPVGDHQAMAEFAIRLLRDPELWHKASTAARAAAEAYSSDEIVGRYEAHYEKVLAS
ncbi:MAG TPA: N-acetyl-alpha-D-glucosaminyl L-malate synthase BshA [Longimicrobiales bacterium]